MIFGVKQERKNILPEAGALVHVVQQSSFCLVIPQDCGQDSWTINSFVLWGLSGFVACDGGISQGRS